MRAAIYARYSSEVQNARSIEDQVAVCTRHAAAKGWLTGNVYSDAAISGAHMVNRPGLNAAVAGAEAGEFDILLVEDEDRIARNLEHLAHVVNRLTYAGASLATLSTDVVRDMDVAFKGLMSADYLRNLSQKTARGMRANAERGLATGARLYGYRSEPGGALAIVGEDAQVIRRIFAEYMDGLTPRAIAEGLNKDRIPSPYRGAWNASTINGSRQRANGILNTELYAGMKVWNRLRTWKDPRTGKKLSKPRPVEEWKRTPVPELRIVDQATWEAARARKADVGAGRPETNVRKRPGIFSGLIRCGVCGGSYTAGSGGRLICTTRRQRGPSSCSNRRTVPRLQIEERVLAALQTRLLAPEAVAIYVKAYHRRWEENRKAELAQRAPVEKRLAEVERRIERGVEAIFDGTATDRIKGALKGLEAEKTQLVERLGAMAETQPPIQLHPRIAESYAAKIGALRERVAAALDDDGKRKLVDAARELVDHISVRPVSDDHAAELEVTLHGRLAAFLQPMEGQTSRPSCTGTMVAGGGYTSSCTFAPANVAIRA